MEQNHTKGVGCYLPQRNFTGHHIFHFCTKGSVL
nr:MAG TPA: hypothetical protein [Caudoviricetes sp.]